MAWITLVAGILGVLLSGAAMIEGITRFWELVRYVPRPIGTLKPRQRVRLRGTLTLSSHGLPLHLSPITATPCCWWQVQIFRGGGKQSRLVHCRQSQDPLYLRDSTGVVILQVETAQSDIQAHLLHQDHNFRWSPLQPSQFRDRRTTDYGAKYLPHPPGSPFPLGNLQVLERGLLPGATLWVWGTVECHPQGLQVQVQRMADSLKLSVAAALVIPLVSLMMVRICSDAVLWAFQVLVTGSP